MDILYITNEVESKMKLFCADELLQAVFDDFSKNAEIIKKEEVQKPSKMWIVSDYINNNSIDIINKMNVILSFIACGGIVQIDNIPYLDVSNPLAIIKQKGLINDVQLETLNDPWFYYYSLKKQPHFTLQQ